MLKPSLSCKLRCVPTDDEIPPCEEEEEVLQAEEEALASRDRHVAVGNLLVRDIIPSFEL